MSILDDWSIPETLQPSAHDVRFDLDKVLDSVVAVHAEIPEDGFTASILGTERVGNGVVIRDDGLVLTIGYLIVEAQTLWLTANGGAVVPGYPLGYDQVTGFGLVQALEPLHTPVLERASAARCEPGDDVFIIGQGGEAHSLKAKLIDKREFAGSWEYVLDEALFTAPAHPQWGGAALVSEHGHLLGIGSLLVQEAVHGQAVQGNMIVPIDLLEPILDDLLTTGRPRALPRPWLGMYTSEVGQHLVVGGVADEGPAASAGIEPGDQVVDVAGEPVTTLAGMFRRIWQLGPAGTIIPLAVSREGNRRHFELKSADRNDFLKKPRLH
jgi:S1-C subfamily serine protease